MFAFEPISASATPPPPPPRSEIAAISASAIAWFQVRERTVRDVVPKTVLGIAPSKWATVAPSTIAVGIITETESPIEPVRPCALAVAWFAEVASTCTEPNGAVIDEVQSTSACVDASEVTSAWEDAPAPPPIRPIEAMFAVAVAVFAEVAWTSTEPALSASPSNCARVAPPTFAVGMLTAIEPRSPPEAASEVAVAVFVEVAVTETEPCARAVAPVLAVTSAALVTWASVPAAVKLSPPIPNEVVVALAVLAPFAVTVSAAEVISPSTAASVAPPTIAFASKMPPLIKPVPVPLVVAVAWLAPV